MERIGGLLRERRIRLNLSQAELALRAGVSQQHVSLLETGRLAPRLDTLERLCGVLGLELSLSPLPGADLRRRLEGLERFNEWQGSEPRLVTPQEAFTRAGELARTRALFPTQSPEDWEQTAREWIEWRRRLPKGSA